MKEWKKNNIKRALKGLIFALQLSISFALFAQDSKQLGVMFYNVENLFDTKDDHNKLDDEFTPHGHRHWNYAKYFQKLKNISRVILESGGWTPPVIIGLCEVENKKVLEDLVWKTGLNHLNYHIIHHESPDLRGIDVAMLYQKNHFTPLESIPISVDLGKEVRPTRDILYVYGLLEDTIPLHILVAHFPSRYGGIQSTKPFRHKAAEILNDTISELLKLEPDANIIAMGDFNDQPEDESMQVLIKNNHIVNVSSPANSIHHSAGTLKHQYEWNTFDQFLISKNLSDSTHTFFVRPPMKILDFSFLMQKDKANMGTKPFRTYIGYQYNNGFSDHFPIWLDLVIQQQASV